MSIYSDNPEILRLYAKFEELSSHRKSIYTEDLSSAPTDFIREAEEVIANCVAEGHEILEHNDGLPEVSINTSYEMYDLQKICDKYDVPYLNIYSSLLDIKLEEIHTEYTQRESVLNELHDAIVKYKESWTPRLIERIDTAIGNKADVMRTLQAISDVLKTVDAFALTEVSGILWRHEWLGRDISTEDIALRILTRRVHR